MAINNEHNERFALEFFLQGNLVSENGIDDNVPAQFITKHLELINNLNLKSDDKEETPKGTLKGKPNVSKQLTKIWKHRSVVRLLSETSMLNPVDEIRSRARKVVLHALENGWSGPPFNAVELAKILEYEISPNDKILDARTIALTKDKYLIEYNPFQKSTRMNFSIAHEIAHTLFSDCYEEIRNREDDPIENRELEQLCNIGAAEFQLPYVIFPNDANEIQEITLESLIDLAKKYHSSLESLFMSFVQTIDRACAIMVCTFHNERELYIDYYKASSKFKPKIPDNFFIPEGSKAYYCTAPGWSSRETVKWDFLDESYNIFCVGLSPMRKENKGRVGIVIVPNCGREELQKSKINIEFGDATKPRGEGIKIIAQVVNTSGGLGFGFGKALCKNYPILKEAVKEWKERKIEFRLGKSNLVKVTNDIYIFQMLAQKGLFTKEGKIPLQYTCLQECLSELREASFRLQADIYMPLIGAGQAKGDWKVIEGLIYSELVNQGVKVNIYMLPGKVQAFKPKSSLSLFNEESTWQKGK